MLQEIPPELSSAECQSLTEEQKQQLAELQLFKNKEGNVAIEVREAQETLIRSHTSNGVLITEMFPFYIVISVSCSRVVYSSFGQDVIFM